MKFHLQSLELPSALAYECFRYKKKRSYMERTETKSCI